MTPSFPDTPRFLERLRSFERIEPFPSRRGAGKLLGIRKLLERLGNPEASPRIVHVAGTNGKGMTSAMIARLLGRRGQSWGLYTSPHVMDLRERITLNGRRIAEAEFAAAGNAVLDEAEGLRAALPLSYFDVLTAIALVAFRTAGVRWAVLETGLGGAADATNVTPKVLCVLTRIGLDHQVVLGDTLREIAGEKLGILRAGVPVVIAAQEPELAPWLAGQARERGAAVIPAETFRVAPGAAPDTAAVTWSDGAALSVPYPAADLTDVRCQCAATALAAADAALGAADPAQRAALAECALATRLPGRMERRTRQRILGGGAVLERVILDGGHNGPALAALVAQLAAWGVREYTLIFGMQADKLVDAALAPLGRLLAEAAHVITLAPQTARAPSPEALDGYLGRALAGDSRRPRRSACADAMAALTLAAREPERTLVVTGSFWMLGDVMRLLEEAPPGVVRQG